MLFRSDPNHLKLTKKNPKSEPAKSTDLSQKNKKYPESKIYFIIETEQKRLNLARTVLDDDVAILTNSTSLLRVSLGGSGIGLGLEVVLLTVRHVVFFGGFASFDSVSLNSVDWICELSDRSRRRRGRRG